MEKVLDRIVMQRTYLYLLFFPPSFICFVNYGYKKVSIVKYLYCFIYLDIMNLKEELIKFWEERGLIKDERLFDAFRAIDRKKFVPKEYLDEAYGDYPLPIEKGQTISQPSTVLIMIQALELKETDKVFEVGTGSGWCAALIAWICKKGKVFTTEIIPELIKFANKNLKKFDLKNLKVLEIDGSEGYAKQAPYDKIIVTAACPKIPEPLIEQLKEGGIIVAPVGAWFGQKMIKARKVKGKLVKENLGYFMFVPLKGKYGYK